jgi:hypothetical protein
MKLAICKMIYLSFITLPPERKIPEISYPNASTITFVATYVKIYAHFICGMTLQWQYNKQIIYENTVADVWNLF